MSDWEISASTQAQLVAVAQAIVANRNPSFNAINGPDGFLIEGFLNSGCRFCINYYKIKMMPTGNTIPNPIGTGTVPEMARVAGVFAIMRWLHPTDNPPPQPGGATGVTLIPLPANSPIGFA